MGKPKIRTKVLILHCGNESQKRIIVRSINLSWLAVYDAVENFNDGKQASIDILKDLNISPGYHTATMCFEINKR